MANPGKTTRTLLLLALCAEAPAAPALDKGSEQVRKGMRTLLFGDYAPGRKDWAEIFQKAFKVPPGISQEEWDARARRAFGVPLVPGEVEALRVADGAHRPGREELAARFRRALEIPLAMDSKEWDARVRRAFLVAFLQKAVGPPPGMGPEEWNARVREVFGAPLGSKESEALRMTDESPLSPEGLEGLMRAARVRLFSPDTLEAVLRTDGVQLFDPKELRRTDGAPSVPNPEEMKALLRRVLDVSPPAGWWAGSWGRMWRAALAKVGCSAKRR